MHVKTAFAWVLGADLLAGVAAVAGSIGLVSGAIQLPSDWLSGSPFSSYTAPGLTLGIAVGGSALGATPVTVLFSRPAGAMASAIAGAVLAGWIVGEVGLIGLVSWMQPVLFGYGVAMVALAALYRDARPSETDRPTRLWRHAACGVRREARWRSGSGFPLSLWGRGSGGGVCS